MQARTLPKLLAALPKDGKAARVQPINWPRDSYYTITQTKLKFREGPEAKDVRVAGRAWGELVWKGKAVPQLPGKHSANARQDALIRGGLKLPWKVVA